MWATVAVWEVELVVPSQRCHSRPYTRIPVLPRERTGARNRFQTEPCNESVAKNPCTRRPQSGTKAQSNTSSLLGPARLVGERT
jgi:hypothetical protein